MPPKRASVSSRSQPPLKGINTWVRIRPIGEFGHTEGDVVEKQLGDFNENAIKIISHDQSDKETTYDYMSRVFPVDCTQEDVADKMLPSSLEDFWGDRNVMVFAYGQTGSGKTHTMFGVQNSLAETTENPGWGLLPRAVHATLQKMDEREAHGIHSVLLLSAVEFYCYQGYDLADQAGKQMCTMKGHQVIGNSYQQCDSTAILAEFLGRVYGNRNVVATKMNDGSSRSHCAITLTLMTLNSNDNTFKQTSFSIVDLAGAERPEKASHTGTRMTKDMAMMELFQYSNRMKKGIEGTLSLELQGYLINLELMFLLDSVVTATDNANHGRPQRCITGSGCCGGSAVAFLGGGIAGEARLEALICLSQSPQNGWETWFSIARYGALLAKLKTRVKKVPTEKMDKALKEAQAAAGEAEQAWANQKDTPSARKYAGFRLGMKVYTEQRLQYMQVLREKAGESAVAT